MKLLKFLLALTSVAFVAPTSLLVSAQTNTTADAPTQTVNNSEVVIGVVVYDLNAALDYIGPVTYFEFLTLVNKTPRFVTISNRAGHIQPESRPGAFANFAYTDAPTNFDVLVIPGGPGDANVIADSAFIDYIRRAGEQSKYVLSICTGGGILAATGLLDGRNATTNKRKFKKITATRPQVNWVRKARWAVDGKFWTSSGVTAGLDMGHAFFGAMYGQAAADQAAALIETVPITDPNNDPFEYVIDLN